jgi:hypothetical protein
MIMNVRLVTSGGWAQALARGVIPKNRTSMATVSTPDVK